MRQLVSGGKKLVLGFCFLSLVPLWNFAWGATEHPFGLGIILFGPTGLSGKYKISNKRAVDGALSWDLDESSRVRIHGDYLLVSPRGLTLDNVALDWYWGVGGRLRAHEKDDDDFGVRAPLGAQYQFKNPRVELFAELALYLNLVPSSDLGLDFGLGARYFF